MDCFRMVSLLVQRLPRSALFLDRFHAGSLLVWRCFSACGELVRRTLSACGDVVLRSFSISQAMLSVTINWKFVTHGVTKYRHGCGWGMPKLPEKWTYTGLSTSFKSWSLYILHIVAGLLLSHIKRSYISWVLLSGVHSS